MSKIGDLFVRLGLKKDDFDRGIKDATRSTKSFGESASKFLGGVAAKFLSVAAAIKVLASSIRTMATFEKANSELAAVLGKTTKEIEKLTESAMELGKRTSFTAGEVTQLQTSLARLGFTENQIISMQESVLKFAAAVGTDLASAADFSGSALRAFGLKASDAQDLLDLMAASCSKSALSFSKLQTSISVVAPVAHAFGLSATDTVAFLGALSNAGFDASSAATALRNILLNLADANGKLAQGLGHTATTMPEIIDALVELRRKGVDLNGTLEMTDKKSVAAFNALLDGADSVRTLREELGECNGSLDQMYNTMEDNLEGSVKRLGSAWDNLILKFRNSTGVLKTITDMLTDLVASITPGHKAEYQGKVISDLAMEVYGGDQAAALEHVRQKTVKEQQALDKAEGEYEKAADKRTRKRLEKEIKRHKQELEYLRIARQNLHIDEPDVEEEAPDTSTPTTPGGNFHIQTEEEKRQAEQDRKRIESINTSAMKERDALAEKYEQNLSLFRKYNQDTTNLTEEFSRNLVAALKIDAEEDDLTEAVMSAPERLQKHYDELLAIMERYGIDATALKDKYNLLLVQADAAEQAELQAEEEALDQWSRTWIEHFAAVNGISLDPLGHELSQFTDTVLEEVDRQEAAMERWQDMIKQFSEAAIGGFSDACQEMADQLMGLSDLNGGAIFQALLTPLADMAIKAGEIIMAEGVATEAAKSALETFGETGWAAIAAGAGLVAAGAAAKSGLKALASSGGGRTTSASTYSGSTGSAGTQDIQTELTVYVKGTIRGSDIVLFGQKTVNSWGR